MNRIAERFERLLDIYRRPDGGRWGGQDLEHATGGAVTRSYVSTLRKGKIESPGFDKLRAIARTMGFPPELWFEDPPGITVHPSLDKDDGAPVSERLERLFETVIDEQEDQPYTNAQVARMSYGRVTEEEVAGIRSGTISKPTLDQVLALSQAFGVDASYFTRQTGRDGALSSLAQEEAAAIVHKTLALSDDERRVVLDLLDHLGRRGTSE